MEYNQYKTDLLNQHIALENYLAGNLSFDELRRMYVEWAKRVLEEKQGDKKKTGKPITF